MHTCFFSSSVCAEQKQSIKFLFRLMAVIKVAELKVAKFQISLKVILALEDFCFVGCMNHPLRLMSCLVSLSLLFKGRRKSSLWKELPVGGMPMGAAAECSVGTLKPES